MDILIVELTAALIDNPATPSACTKIEITLENSTGRLSVEDCEGSPRSVHRFTVRDAIDLGCGGVHSLTKEQAAIVLAISCSLSNPHILFSPLQPQQFIPSLKPGKTPSKKVETVDTPTKKQITTGGILNFTRSLNKLLETKLSLDEVQVLHTANSLLTLKIFNKTNRSCLELNVLGSIERYKEAPKSTEGLSCYMSLYSAFEKAVNADNDQRGVPFDAAASVLTGLMEADIESLRLFNNRIKHALRRNRNDLSELIAGETQLAQLALNLKKAADSAILSRIS